MSETAGTLHRLRAGSAVLLLLSAGIALTSFFVELPVPHGILTATAAALATIFAALVVATRWIRWSSRRRRAAAATFVENDSSPALCTDPDGTIFALNAAAIARYGDRSGAKVAEALESLLASPEAVVARIAAAAGADASAQEDVVARKGDVRISAHRVPGAFVWRIEPLGERPTRGADGGGLPMLTFGPSGTILFMNDVMRAATGQRTRRIQDLFETVPLTSGGLNKLLTSDGSEPVRVILSGAAGGRQDAFVIAAGDAVDERIALDDLPVALLRLDGEGRVIFASRLARDLLPALDATDEKRFAALVEGLGRSVREWVGDAASGRGLYRAEVVRVTGAEVETYLQVTLGRPLGDPDGGLLAVLNDATELKTLEAQFVQSQKMQAIGQLAGGVAHDFNNLLTAISGHCDLLLLRHEENDEDFADLTQIMHNANRAAALVGQLLAFSRKQTLEMRPIDLRDALGDLAHLLNRLVGERVSLRLEHDPALIPIRGDRRQLEQVLMNLVVNARDAMPDGGDVLIETRCRYLDKALTRDRVTVPPGQYVVVEVTDQGSGISPDNLSRIFEPFFTTKRPGEGTGLGLSMAYGIIKQSGGFIFADSTIGLGTKFSLYFPAMTEEVSGPSTTIDDAVRIPGSDGTGREPSNGAIDAGNSVRSSELEGTEEAAPGGAEPSMDDVSDRASALLPASRASKTSVSAGDEGPSVGSPMGPPRAPAADAPGMEIARVMAAVAAKRNLTAAGGRHGPSDGPTTDQTFDSDRGDAVEPDGSTGGGSGGPASRAEAPNCDRGSSPTVVPSSAVEAGKPVVLLVEDEAPVRAFASRALRLRGYRVVEAENAESALEQLEDASLSVDLFVTDVMMPGLDGPSWVREALKSRPNVRTVFISGYTQDALSETSQPVPNAVFLPKPFSLSDLTRTVEKALL